MGLRVVPCAFLRGELGDFGRAAIEVIQVGEELKTWIRDNPWVGIHRDSIDVYKACDDAYTGMRFAPPSTTH